MLAAVVHPCSIHFSARSSMGDSKGGSRNTISKVCGVRLNHRNASVWRISADEVSNRCLSTFIWATNTASCSTNWQKAAPRDNASKPSAPVPAKRSRQRAPGKCIASQLNRVSRMRSAVGRNSRWAAMGMRVRRQRPPMIRTAPLAQIPMAVTNRRLARSFFRQLRSRDYLCRSAGRTRP